MEILFFVFCLAFILKILGVISMSWWIVFLPILIFVPFLILAFYVVYIYNIKRDKNFKEETKK